MACQCGGLSYWAGMVYVYDQGAGRVVVLDEHLRAVRSFGRLGDGPGEFEDPEISWATPRYWDFGFVSAAPSGLAVYDGEAVELFGLMGDYQGRIGSLLRYGTGGLRYIARTGEDEVLFAVDSVDFRGSTPRKVQTWRATREKRAVLWEDPTADLPRPGKRSVVMPARQARPLWAAPGGCVVTSDGSSPLLFVRHLASEVVDTIALPHWEPPALTRAEQEQAEGVLRAVGRVSTTSVEPTALLRWTDLSVDPSGHAWVEFWRDDPAQPARVVRVDLESGVTLETVLPAFPKVFGPPGV